MSGCLGTSRGSSRGSSCRPSSTTSTTLRVWVPRHVAQLVVPLVVDYSASRRLVADYFAYAARLGASARCAARHVARRAARHRLLRLAPLVDDYFASAARPGTSARRAARRRLLRLHRVSDCFGYTVWHVARLVAPLVVDYFASRRLVIDYFVYAARPVASATPRGMSHGSLRRSSSTTSPRAVSSSTTSPLARVWVPQHVARLVTRLVTRLVVDYFVYAARPDASAHCVARRVAPLSARRRLLRLAQARRRLLRLCHASGCLGMSRGSSSTTPPRAGLSSTTSPTPRDNLKSTSKVAC
jgi:hypothetical protein